jgi:hypothetical protein
LRKKGYKAPVEGKDCGFQLGFSTELHFFEWLATNPEYQVRFMNHMSAYHQGRPSWMDAGFYPVEERLVKGLHEDAPLLVDVGGSTGHDLEEFGRKHPAAQGRQLVLQDLPDVIENARKIVSSDITAMEHDFFKEQPVKGTYLFQNCCHVICLHRKLSHPHLDLVPKVF